MNVSATHGQAGLPRPLVQLRSTTLASPSPPAPPQAEGTPGPDASSAADARIAGLSVTLRPATQLASSLDRRLSIVAHENPLQPGPPFPHAARRGPRAASDVKPDCEDSRSATETGGVCDESAVPATARPANENHLPCGGAL